MAPFGEDENKQDVENQLINFIRNMPPGKQKELLALLNEWRVLGKRASERRQCLIAVDYASGERLFKDFIREISASGAFIETREMFLDGEDMALSFTMPNSPIPFRIAGTIARTTPEGIAVTFDKLSSYQQEILKSLVTKI